jgi:hypothetical protein
MKKLALALVCFASVAFIASCTPEITNPEPSIAVKTGENYVYDGQTVDLGQNYTLGFRAASNSQTLKELATFKLNVKFTTLDDTETKSYDSIVNVSGTEYTFEQVLNFGLTNTEESRELVAKAVFTATITDVDGKMNSTTINLNINQPAVDLAPTAFTWYRLNSTITGLDEFGLEWKGNYPKDYYAKLVPMDNVKLFIFEAKDWDNVKTDLDKNALFNHAIETMHTADEYWEVNVTQGTVTYDDVIGTIMPDGTCHLIHVTGSHSETVSGQGTATTITGEAK